MALKLGRKARAFNLDIPHYHAVRRMAAAYYQFPPLQSKLDWAEKLPQDLGMMLNDQLGCCTCAAIGHSTQLTSLASMGQEITVPDSEILSAYEGFGYRPGDPSTDNGVVIQDVLSWWKSTGMDIPNGKHQILGYVEIDPRQPTDVAEAIQEGGYVYIGFEVPSGLMDAVESQGLTTWDASPDFGAIEGGHCVILTGFDYTNQYNPTFNVISWGSRQYKMTANFMNQYVDEIYMNIDPLWIASSGKSPLGLTVEQIEQIAQHL